MAGPQISSSNDFVRDPPTILQLSSADFAREQARIRRQPPPSDISWIDIVNRDLLAEWYRESYSYELIAALFQTSASNIRAQTTRLRRESKIGPWGDLEESRAWRMHLAQETNDDIAKALRRKPSDVKSHLGVLRKREQRRLADAAPAGEEVLDRLPDLPRARQQQGPGSTGSSFDQAAANETTNQRTVEPGSNTTKIPKLDSESAEVLVPVSEPFRSTSTTCSPSDITDSTKTTDYASTTDTKAQPERTSFADRSFSINMKLETHEIRPFYQELKKRLAVRRKALRIRKVVDPRLKSSKQKESKKVTKE